MAFGASVRGRWAGNLLLLQVSSCSGTGYDVAHALLRSGGPLAGASQAHLHMQFLPFQGGTPPGFEALARSLPPCASSPLLPPQPSLIPSPSQPQPPPPSPSPTPTFTFPSPPPSPPTPDRSSQKHTTPFSPSPTPASPNSPNQPSRLWAPSTNPTTSS